ncbi:isocitrate lyase/phosphoenolpyruvate mutase family protein [Bradyrhizobium sp. LHD-71]|uniref:isocitrate lyase/PEP mutase family protein n=1 Tax=Bradyrhizobium sp. LHD-71 TaxID=3072141 RepID=UPI00280E7E6A|nr:isocitrate lyase/phosphoenolpyruvate mutase family protein [Bradyrhizobium sp. LHD-71]MDQ8729205.1 isocitrate lyase/phosphoenolpyruvate mutase family protein [Bradyrhizobium sp. LHD-71]
MDWRERRERFRAVLAGSHCIGPASVFDPLSARIAEEIGFEAGMFAGSVASLTVLGAPDIVLLSATEFAHQAYRICRASTLPLIVDADHGYGNALNVRATVSELETAGVSALTIEDTSLPRAFGATKSGLISIDEAVGKLRAAVDGREDRRLVLVGRTNVAAAGLDNALSRVKAYARTGVDAIFLARLKTREELDALASAVELPLMLGSVPAEMKDYDYLASRKVRVCLQGHKPIMAAVQAVHDTLLAQRSTGPTSIPVPTQVSAELLAHLTRADHYERSIKDFLA